MMMVSKGNSYIEHLYYKYDYTAVNEPLRFIASMNGNAVDRTYPAYAMMLNLTRAFVILGKLGQAIDTLDRIQPELERSADCFFLCKYQMLKHNISSMSATECLNSGSYLAIAMNYQKSCRSKALECEVTLLNCLSGASDRELSQSEEMLSEAMKSALESNVSDLVFDVYLSYIELYLASNQPDMAYHEFMLIKDQIDLNQHPYKYVKLLNQAGIMLMMLDDYAQAEQYLAEGITEAEARNYNTMLAILCLNMGIANKRNKDFESSLSMIDKTLQILAVDSIYNTVLQYKAIDNKAYTLGMMGKNKESCDLLFQSIETAIALGDEKRENTANVNLADILIELEEFSTAEQLLNKAIAYFSKTRSLKNLQNANLCKARLFEAQQKFEEAFACMEDVYRVGQSYFSETFSKQAEKFKNRIERLRNEYVIVKSQCSTLDNTPSNLMHNELIGEHPLIKKALENALQAAKYPYVNVIILGESGTGKEIIARIIHNASLSKKPIVAVNAAAISQNLIESELFGHVKGAFTGAINDQKGKFVLANHGTLFLDEISEMPVECQAKLLRAIEHKSITPVGSDKEFAVQCRIISATNCQMSDLIRQNKFRLDLYHRLNKVEIHLPPLRERLSDLELLTGFFIKRFATEFGQPLPRVDESFYHRLRGYNFPGNVRELMNIVERIFILKPKSFWNADQLDGLVPETNPIPQKETSIAHNLNNTELQIISDALRQANNVQKEAARLLGMTESTLSRHMKKLGIRK